MEKLNKKVLIVDDESGSFMPLETAFSGAGFDVIIAKDGQEGFDAVKKENPDIIILDIYMPKMDGIEMAKRLKADGVNIPIIFLTQLKDAEHIANALESYRADSDYIIKTEISLDEIVRRAKTKLGLE